MPMNVPVRPTPALQCTTQGWTARSSLQARHSSIISTIGSGLSGTPWSGQVLNQKCLISREMPFLFLRTSSWTWKAAVFVVLQTVAVNSPYSPDTSASPSGQYRSHLAVPFSTSPVTMTMQRASVFQTIRQNASIVFGSGPWVAT